MEYGVRNVNQVSMLQHKQNPEETDVLGKRNHKQHTKETDAFGKQIHKQYTQETDALGNQRLQYESSSNASEMRQRSRE